LEICNNWTSKNWSGLPKEVQMMIARGISRTEDYIEYEERKVSKVAEVAEVVEVPAEPVEVADVVEVVEVVEDAESYIVYTVESYQTIKSKSFNKKSHAIDQAKKWVLENSKQHVYISGYRSKDGQDFYINPNGNAELIGKSWGENNES
jgi:hypothetical protein